MTIRSLDDYKKRDENGEETLSSYAGGERSGIAVDHPRGHEDGTIVRVTLYSNGFFINDGTFRSLDIEANRNFIKAMRSGVASAELAKYALKGEVSIALLDKSNEKYDDFSESEDVLHDPALRDARPTVIKLFGGPGRTLQDRASPAATTQLIVKEPESNSEESNSGIQVDLSLPVTTLQFRFHNGRTVRQSFNESHTIGDVFDFATRTANIPEGFELLTGFPKKVIKEPMNKTLQECGLLNSTVSQRPLRT